MYCEYELARPESTFYVANDFSTKEPCNSFGLKLFMQYIYAAQKVHLFNDVKVNDVTH